MESTAHGGRRRGRAGRCRRRYQTGIPYARAPGVGRRWRDRGGRQRELQGQPDRIIERVRVQHAGLFVRHRRRRCRRGCRWRPDGSTPLAV